MMVIERHVCLWQMMSATPGKPARPGCTWQRRRPERGAEVTRNQNVETRNVDAMDGMIIRDFLGGKPYVPCKTGLRVSHFETGWEDPLDTLTIHLRASGIMLEQIRL